ncbi:RagB/SusD domain-containing protein [Archangium gephyra]|uniref:Outer membrane protein n=1 Tax=Archangium gephyra TaxID=48 RepID=A0AAC8QHD9_9BACT|nr:RagB/SusD family nutrient uptake outer membrane protein [Archangium gephyra]AKJ07508.1 putative outer membrane protein [Archangium gephyra]REG19096.1 RagB/SusD domain-containing protein [Archangium gephyra]
MKNMKKVVLALCATVGLGGCGDLTVPDLNNPSLESFQETPTRTAVINASTGLLIGSRAGMTNQNGYVALTGVLGREGIVLDSADPRYVGEMLQAASLNGGSPAFGGNFWNNPYANIRNANTLLNALAKVDGVTEAEKNAIRGFAKTIQALDFLVIINTRDTHGAPIDVNRPFGADLAPIESKEKVLAHIANLLDEAYADLAAGGTAFPFPLSSGFKDFTPRTDGKVIDITVPNFSKVNRALKARVDVYRERWTEALVDLEESFITTAPGKLDLGVYHAYSTGSGDVKNTLNGPNIFANPILLLDAQRKSDDTLDERVARKVKDAENPGELPGVIEKFSKGFAAYESDSAPIPIIRNEELLLLRAEANIRLGLYEAAKTDLDIIRETSGGLDPLPETLEGEQAINELLYQRRFSLLFEGGHRWIDMRRYGKLEELKREDPPGMSFNVHPRFPIPTTEFVGRPTP